VQFSRGESNTPEASEAFPNTRWSVVLDAQGEDAAALALFCRAYWFPLYCCARRMGKSVDDAEDLTQAFFERLLARQLLEHAKRDRGKLRSFLIASFTRFAAEEWRRSAAQKRGGATPLLEIDAMSAEERYALEPHNDTTPETEYERAWARELLRQALARLETHYRTEGKGPVFDAFRDQLVEGVTDRPHKETAAALGLTEASARFAVFKLRERFRGALCEVVAETVESRDEVDGEIAYLSTLFRR
jgi:RNA polymerase sigma factor (sigma-70 family)